MIYGQLAVETSIYLTHSLDFLQRIPVSAETFYLKGKNGGNIQINQCFALKTNETILAMKYCMKLCVNTF